MKNIKKLAGILIILLVSGSLTLSAQRGIKGMRSDSLKMKYDSTCMWMNGRKMPMGMHRDSMNMRHGYGMWRMEPGRRGPGAMRQMGPRSEMMARGRGDQRDMMRGNHGMRMSGIPNLTAKQKEDMAKINETQQKEMQKLREEQQKEMKTIRDSHLEKVKSILTDEQKKWVEENKF